MTNIRSKKCKVLQISLKVLPNVETPEFATAFLSIYNNVRENKDVFLDMTMTYDSSLYVIIHPEDKEAVVNWLKTFDYVWDAENIQIEEVSRTIIDDWNDDWNEDIILRHVGSCKSLDDFEKIIEI